MCSFTHISGNIEGGKRVKGKDALCVLLGDATYIPTKRQEPL
jgi:hypothetical protein